jgi:hypothetical protein
MVDVQTIGVVVTATSVSVAATYYLLTLITNQRNSRISIAYNMLQSILTNEKWLCYGELLNMSWSSYDDFEKKYGSDHNLDNFSKRQSVFCSFDVIGSMVKSGLADFKTVYDSDTWIIIWFWEKFKEIIEEQRLRYSGEEYLEGFEYIAKRILEVKRLRDPGYSIPKDFIKYVPNQLHPSP